MLVAQFDAAVRATDRLFFALLPDADAAAQLAQCSQRLRSQLGLTGRPIATERLHITLHFVSDSVGLPPGMVAALSAAVASIAAPPFDITLDRAKSFCRKPRNRPFVLVPRQDIPALNALQRSLAAAMTQARLGQHAESQFRPHLTLLYDDRCVTVRAIETIAWTAREFVLVHSLIGRARHIELARWPLRAQRSAD